MMKNYKMRVLSKRFRMLREGDYLIIESPSDLKFCLNINSIER